MFQATKRRIGIRSSWLVQLPPPFSTSTVLHYRGSSRIPHLIRGNCQLCALARKETDSLQGRLLTNRTGWERLVPEIDGQVAK